MIQIQRGCIIFSSYRWTIDTLKSLINKQGGYVVFLLLSEYSFIRDFRVIYKLHEVLILKFVFFSRFGTNVESNLRLLERRRGQQKVAL